MKVEKLTIEHLAAYLPYGATCILNKKGVFNLDEEYPQPHFEICRISNILIPKNKDVEIEIETINGDYGNGFIGLDEIDLILRPLSDLTKEVEHNGKKVTVLWNGEDEGSDNFLIEDLDCPTQLNLDGTWIYLVGMMDYGDLKILLEYHFDVFGLIDAGLAIDINKI